VAFNPEEHLIEIGGKKYLETKYRLMWFRQDHPSGCISTEIATYDPLVVRCVVSDENGRTLATGHGTAIDTGKAVWRGRAIEKAETAAQGRALGAAGYGTQFAMEGDDDNEAAHLADAPVKERPAQPKTPVAGSWRGHFLDDPESVGLFRGWMEKKFTLSPDKVLESVGLDHDNMPRNGKAACEEVIRRVIASGGSENSTPVRANALEWVEDAKSKYFIVDTVLGKLRLYGSRKEAAAKLGNPAVETAKAGDTFNATLALAWTIAEGAEFATEAGWNVLPDANQSSFEVAF